MVRLTCACFGLEKLGVSTDTLRNSFPACAVCNLAWRLRIIESDPVQNDSGQLPGRIVALDVGRKRIGIAVSDPLRIAIRGLPTLRRTRLRDDLEVLARLFRELEPALVLVGLPLHLSGDDSRQTAYVREFAAKLESAAATPVRLWDERLTTVAADEALRERGVKFEDRRSQVDQMAAIVLLESYLATAPGGKGESRCEPHEN
ncbi:MAG: Holliday junction resolvase RuvX [Bryobacteraceae bacterium]|nr:Holliday junction resolvase RuvX [Bryobacteraceae bacterium]